jgi:predicted nucleic acid-binding protein
LSGTTLVDAGPLVAFLNRGDAHHAWARSQLARLHPPLVTCEAVLAEACELLRRHPGGVPALLTVVDRGLVAVGFRLDEHVRRVAELMDRYADAPMSLADACLVRMSELSPGADVLTLDPGFRHYRRLGRQTIPLIIP